MGLSHDHPRRSSLRADQRESRNLRAPPTLFRANRQVRAWNDMSCGRRIPSGEKTARNGEENDSYLCRTGAVIVNSISPSISVPIAAAGNRRKKSGPFSAIHRLQNQPRIIKALGFLGLFAIVAVLD